MTTAVPALGLPILALLVAAPPARPPTAPAPTTATAPAPAAGGQAATATAPGPTAAAPPGHVSDVNADLVMILEVNENAVSVQENWTFHSHATVPASELRIPVPERSRFLRTDTNTSFIYKPDETSTGLDATGPLPPGDHELIEGYVHDFTGSALELQRTLPFSMGHVRVVLPDLPDIKLTANVEAQRHPHDVNGRSFVFFDLAPLPAGGALDLTISGLPSKTIWPKRAATAAVFAIVAWMIWALATRRVPGHDARLAQAGPLSPQARRDQIVKALELLERDYKAEKIKEKGYQRRQAELMRALGEALKEIEMEKHASISGASSA